MNKTITSLRAKCALKSSENKRLRNTVNRLTKRANTLKELLEDLKQKKLLSKDAEEILQVSKYIFQAE